MTRTPDEHPTIRESTIPDTRRRGAGSQKISEYIEPRLIGPVFQGYKLIRQFPAAGGEADIWLIQRDADYAILKHYRLGIEPKLDVLEKVREISRKNPHHIIRIDSFGYDDETKRWYEILEYARNGSLKELIRDQRVSMVQFRTIIDNIASGLNVLHRSGILHLDLKPSNILVRSLHPLNLILTDFGISTLLDEELSRQITSTKGTPMYWAPEQLGNVVGKEADFWALGVIALEIIQHKHPFEGMNHNIILSTLSTKGIQVPANVQPKTAVLLKGLLTRNPGKRWGMKEVSQWIAGRQNIPVFFEEEHVSGTEHRSPYEFRGEQYRNLTELSYAFLHDPDAWDDAKRHIGRGYLTRWLEKTEQYGQAVEIEKFTDQYPDEDERLLYLTTRFNNDIPFTLLGKPLDIASITHYLGRYLNHKNDDQEKRIISMLFSGELNRIYNTYTGISGNQDKFSLSNRMFAWLSSNTRGTDEKKRLFEFLKVLREREEIGIPEEWDTSAVLKLAEIRDLFLRQGYDNDSYRVEEELKTACLHALEAETIEPDLLVALAAVSEEMGLTGFVSPCLRKASESDIRVISLLFSRKKGILRFRLYKKMRVEYETNLYSLSSDPWKEPEKFWKDLFFIVYSGGNLPLTLSVSERLIELNRIGAEGWAMRGVTLAKMGRVKEADFFLSHKVVQTSEKPLVWQIIGEYHAGSGRSDDAEKSYLRGLEAEKSHPGSLHGLMKLYASQKKYRKVIELCDAALISPPDNQGFLLQKGDAQFALGLIQDATRTYEQYLAIAPENTEVLKCLARCQIKLKRNSEAEKSLDLLLKQGKGDPQVLRLKAYLLLITGKIQEAIQFLEMTLRLEPADVWALRIKADAHISLKEYGQALGCIDLVLSREPENYLFIEKKGKILLSLGFSSTAAESLKLAIDGKRDSADLLIRYGDALRRKGDNRYGSPSVQELADQPLKWRVSYLYLDLWQSSDLSGRQIELLMEALEWYDRSLSLGSDKTEIWNRKGIIVCNLGDYDQATTLFEQAAGTKKQEPSYLTNLAGVHILKGDLDRGSALFLQGMSKFSKKVYFLDQYAGMHYYYKRDYETALDLIRQASQVNDSHDPIILSHQYQILIAMGRTLQARELVQTIRAIDPWFVISDESPADHPNTLWQNAQY